jgi:hypothetical protein
MDQRFISFPVFGRDLFSPEQVSERERTAVTQLSNTRIAVLVSLAVLSIVTSAIRWWRRYGTKRTLMALSAWQRADCGMECRTCPRRATSRRRPAVELQTG